MRRVVLRPAVRSPEPPPAHAKPRGPHGVTSGFPVRSPQPLPAAVRRGAAQGGVLAHGARPEPDPYPRQPDRVGPGALHGRCGQQSPLTAAPDFEAPTPPGSTPPTRKRLAPNRRRHTAPQRQRRLAPKQKEAVSPRSENGDRPESSFRPATETRRPAP